MIFIEHYNTNPYINHAIEEYVMDKFSEDCFMIWRNRPCILIGKNQNTMSEINVNYVRKHNLSVVRRMSGGGAIFNDLGTLNFTFIVAVDDNTFADFGRFTEPIVRSLKKLNIDVELSGRNDLIVNGRKFSGNSQCKHENKILHHGSILFSVNMENLNGALNANSMKFSDKSVKSVRSRVTNLCEYLKKPMTVVEFKDFLIKSIMEEFKCTSIYRFSRDDWKKIKKISDQKYALWQWNYGSFKRFTYSNEKKFRGGVVQVNINVYKGIIDSIKFFGDFFSSGEIGELEDKFIGVKYDKDEILKVLKNVNVEKYMHSMSNENIMEVMF
ncbi:lipoate--protein ligase [Clostridium luticellarii]|uniref:lipoate--protein ligase n=1 Tax=Clostridium luticellarii TaxID=1691940 RepID=A0A2T0BDT4_9CLOT|nr:lipoate--protein ligase [Clostridium luticellarii]MCI1944247.1 lipoate--protein ligase [Clostridium luticellarii]MCI1967743.1 lipoate--protein ligase [Clostridium luticellarii]MCI1994621.1 lipoate--protein ligase [Clostridium luticellarii]MCI2038882.1 lipoate--protein ligase [Clostridium luticellarii]PRR82058.1 Lipoate-protein ligase LplJ [Clostridium luticellarii]